MSYFKPVTLQVGSFYEPMGLEWTNSKNTVEFLERAMVFTGLLQHLGFAALTHLDRWSVKGGVFGAGFGESSLQPAAGTPLIFGVPAQAGWVPTGAAQCVKSQDG